MTTLPAAWSAVVNVPGVPATGLVMPDGETAVGVVAGSTVVTTGVVGVGVTVAEVVAEVEVLTSPGVVLVLVPVVKSRFSARSAAIPQTISAQRITPATNIATRRPEPP